MSHLFSIAGLGPIVFFYRWITWPGVLLGCFLVLNLMLLSFDWLNSSLFLTGNRIAHLSHDRRPSFSLLCLSTTGFCSVQRRSRSVHFLKWIIFAYDALVVVVLLLVWLAIVMSFTFSSFFFISLVYFLKCPAVTLFILLHCSGR